MENGSQLLSMTIFHALLMEGLYSLQQVKMNYGY